MTLNSESAAYMISIPDLRLAARAGACPSHSRTASAGNRPTWRTDARPSARKARGRVSAGRREAGVWRICGTDPPRWRGRNYETRTCGSREVRGAAMGCGGPLSQIGSVARGYGRRWRREARTGGRVSVASFTSVAPQRRVWASKSAVCTCRNRDAAGVTGRWCAAID